MPASDRTLTGYILYSNDVLLPDVGAPGRRRARRHPSLAADVRLEGPIFDHFFQTDEAMRTFLMGMHGYGVLSSPEVVAAFDLSRFRRLVDLGGATGHLAIAACERYPDLRAAVFDLPRVIAVAREQVSRSPAAARIELIAGDFFADDLPEADLFAVGRILHDWSEEKIGVLLAKIYARLPAGGGLLIAEKLLAEDKTGPAAGAHAVAQHAGVHRGHGTHARRVSRAARSGGFWRCAGPLTGAPLDAVLAIKS